MECIKEQYYGLYFCSLGQISDHSQVDNHNLLKLKTNHVAIEPGSSVSQELKEFEHLK